jgi:hypothetical protein
LGHGWAYRWLRIEDRLFRGDRLVLYGAAVVMCFLILIAVSYFRHIWFIGETGEPRPIDFIATWSAARLTLAGKAAEAYDLAAITGEQLKAVGAMQGRYPWAYPPTYFLLVAPLGFLTYLQAMAIWLLATLVAYLASIRAIQPGRVAMLLAAASPFALWNSLDGQNGFLTAALIGGILVNLDRRPVLAGILLGLLTWKPHFGILFPIVLALTGRWRCFAAAAITTLMLVGASLALFGVDTWRAFFAALQTQGDLYLNRGPGFSWGRMQSVLTLVRFAGGGMTLAWVAHGMAACAAMGFVCWLWLRPVRYELKAAALSAAALLATPYLFQYDLVVLSVPVAFLLRDGRSAGFIPGERSLMVVLAFAMFGLTGMPVAVFLLLAIFGLIAFRIRMPQAAAGSPGIGL